MTRTSTLRRWWADWACDTSKMERVSFPGVERTWDLMVADASVLAWEVFARIMVENSYLFRETAGGTYKCRTIGSSSKMSLHSYGLALDLNPRHNPQGYPVVHNYPQTFIDDIEALKTNNAKSVFTWGGRWSASTPPDPMHWQIDCKPSDIATGIAYEGMEVTLKRGDKGDAVAKFQRALNAWNPDLGLVVDKVFGPATESGVKSYQHAADLSESGEIDGVTAALLLEYVKDSVGGGTQGPPGPPGPQGPPGPAPTSVSFIYE